MTGAAQERASDTTLSEALRDEAALFASIDTDAAKGLAERLYGYASLAEVQEAELAEWRGMKDDYVKSAGGMQ